MGIVTSGWILIAIGFIGGIIAVAAIWWLFEVRSVREDLKRDAYSEEKRK